MHCGLDLRFKFASQRLPNPLVTDSRSIFQPNVPFTLLGLNFKADLHRRNGTGCCEGITVVRIVMKKNGESLLRVLSPSLHRINRCQIPKRESTLRRLPKDILQGCLSSVNSRSSLGIVRVMHEPVRLGIDQLQLEDWRVRRLADGFVEVFDRLPEVL